jgi:dTMP kinase
VNQGKLIVIEGIDGAGTTTQSRMLVDWIVSVGRKAVLTSEPSTGPVGLLLRQILSGRTIVRERAPAGGFRAVSNNVISLLFAADRMDHLDAEVAPLLRDGINVVCDRYYHSSFTYQALEGDLNWICTLNEHALRPDVTFLLDLPAELAASRRQLVRASEELYETEPTQRKLQEAYLGLPDLLTDELILVVDGRADAQSVHDAIVNELKRLFGWS